MGLLDLIRPRNQAVQNTKSALEAANDGSLDDGTVTKMVQGLLNIGLDGKGPIDSATQIADKARAENDSIDDAVKKVISDHVRTGAAGGFLTGLGGFITLPVALPANVAEFYIQATRMVGAVASLRGYDVHDPRVRSAILLTLIGSNADEVLQKAGIATGGGRMASLASRSLGPAARLIINKGVGFQLLKSVGEKTLARLGKGIPFVGGVVGAGFDGYMMKKIGDAAEREFPVKAV